MVGMTLQRVVIKTMLHLRKYNYKLQKTLKTLQYSKYTHDAFNIKKIQLKKLIKLWHSP